MSVSIWLVLPCVWASLGQLWVKIRGILIDLGAIIFFGRLRLSGKEGVTRIPESKRARQPTWPYTRHTPQDHEVVACDGPRHRCRRERGVCLPDRTGRVWCLQCGTRPRRAACDRQDPTGGLCEPCVKRSVASLAKPRVAWLPSHCGLTPMAGDGRYKRL